MIETALLDVARAVLRASIEVYGLPSTVQLLAEVSAEHEVPGPTPILAEHGQRIAALERQCLGGHLSES